MINSRYSLLICVHADHSTWERGRIGATWHYCEREEIVMIQMDHILKTVMGCGWDHYLNTGKKPNVDITQAAKGTSRNSFTVLTVALED